MPVQKKKYGNLLKVPRTYDFFLSKQEKFDISNSIFLNE